MLKLGSTGPMVRHRQHQLKVLGYYHGNLDGIFGSMTHHAVVRFQAEHNLSPDGIIGPATAAALDHAVMRQHGMVLKIGSRSDMVAMVQQKLYMLGFYHGMVDGVFGPNTEAAVRAFQQSVGLPVDGIVGPRTMTALHNA